MTYLPFSALPDCETGAALEPFTELSIGGKAKRLNGLPKTAEKTGR